MHLSYIDSIIVGAFIIAILATIMQLVTHKDFWECFVFIWAGLVIIVAPIVGLLSLMSASPVLLVIGVLIIICVISVIAKKKKQ